MRDQKRQKGDAEEKERNFCAYVNGPNKDIATNKEIHELKRQMQNPVESQRRKWHSPPTVVPRIQGEEYNNPVFPVGIKI